MTDQALFNLAEQALTKAVAVEAANLMTNEATECEISIGLRLEAIAEALGEFFQAIKEPT